MKVAHELLKDEKAGGQPEPGPLPPAQPVAKPRKPRIKPEVPEHEKNLVEVTSLEDIQRHRDQIVSSPAFDEKKEKNEAEFREISDLLEHFRESDGNTRGDLSKIIGESYKRGKYLFQELRAAGFKDVPPYLQEEIAKFARNLVKMPTEYFEAKPQRVVGINEFKGAVVPHDVKPEILALLAHHGIEHIEHYDRVEGNPFRQDKNRAQALARLASAQKLLLSEEDLDLAYEPLHKADRFHVALITAYDHEGKLLLGRRNDNQLFTLPGGHLRPGEDARDAAHRELEEETGLQALSLSPLTVHELPNNTVLHCFSALVNGMPHGEHDPDRECDEWKFVDVSNGLPKRIANKLHGPQDVDSNLLLRLFNIEERPEAVSKSIADTWHGAETQQESHVGHTSLAGALVKPFRPTNAMAEVTMPHLEHLEKAFNDHQKTIRPVPLDDADLQGGPGYSPKIVYKVPVPGHAEPQRFMCKLYHFGDVATPYNMNGYREGTFHALAHAGGVGHLCQRSFVATHGTGADRMAVTVIPMDNASPMTSRHAPWSKLRSHSTEVQTEWQHQARQITIMDYLTANTDRHNGNIMMRNEGDRGLLAVDHGEAMAYGSAAQRDSFSVATRGNAARKLIDRFPTRGDPPPGGWTRAMEWWKQAGPAMRQAFAQRQQLILAPAQREKMQQDFEFRAGWLDRLAADPRMESEDLTWEAYAHQQYLEELEGRKPKVSRPEKWQVESLPSSTGPSSTGPSSMGLAKASGLGVPALPKPPTSLQPPHPGPASPAQPAVSRRQAESQKQSHWGHEYMAKEQARIEKRISPAQMPTNHMGEITMPHLAHFEKAFNEHSNTEPRDGDLQKVGGNSPKVLHDIPMPGSEGTNNTQRMMVKLSHHGSVSYPENMSGHREGTTQAVYHAGKIGHLCQRSFAGNYGTGKHRVPVTVIPMDKGTPYKKWDHSKLGASPFMKQKLLRHQARLIGLMDYLLGNDDRHMGNLMMREGEGGLLAIDNGEALSYERKGGLHGHLGSRYFMNRVIDRLPHNGPRTGGWTDVMAHWREHGQAMRDEFISRQKLVVDPTTRQKLIESFEQRAGWLDRLAADPRMASEDLSWEPKAHSDYRAELRRAGTLREKWHENLINRFF